jgi:ATP-binding cassette subfamily F protein 3
MQYTGTLVFISHDLHFIRSVANRVVRVEHGRVEMYEGDWEYYQRRRAAQTGTALPAKDADPRAERATAAPPKARKADRRAAAEAVDARNRERRAREAGVAKLEKEIQALEAREKELTAALEDQAIYGDGPRLESVNRELAEIQQKLPGLTREWENAAWALNEG